MMPTTNNKQVTDYILPILALGLSLFSLTRTYDFSNIFSLVISLTGIIAGVLFFLKRSAFRMWIQIWIYCQFPAITNTDSLQKTSNGSRVVRTTHIINGGQAYTLTVGFFFSSSSTTTAININLVPVAYIILYRLMLYSGLIGKKLTVYKFRADNKLGDVFPIDGIIVRKVEASKDGNWVLVQLDKELNYGGQAYGHLLLKSKEGEIYKPGTNKYLSWIRLVNDATTVGDIINKDKYPFVEWGIVQVK